MKKLLLPSIIGFIGIVLIVYGCATNEVPVSKSIETECTYDKGECPNDDCNNHTFEYSFDLEPDSIIVYNGNRLVGKVAINWERPSPLDSLLLKDNQ